MPVCERRVPGGGTIGEFIGKESSGSFHAIQWQMRKDLFQNRSPAVIAKCSATGPSASAGRNVSPPTITITPVSKAMNRMPVVGKVPGFQVEVMPLANPGSG